MQNLTGSDTWDFPKSSRTGRIFIVLRQLLDGSDYRFRLCVGSEQWSLSVHAGVPNSTTLDASDLGETTEVAGGGHRVERAGNDLGGPGAVGAVGGLGFEQLGVREDYPELVIQPVEHLAQVGLALQDGRDRIRHQSNELTRGGFLGVRRRRRGVNRR